MRNSAMKAMAAHVPSEHVLHDGSVEQGVDDSAPVHEGGFRCKDTDNANRSPAEPAIAGTLSCLVGSQPYDADKSQTHNCTSTISRAESQICDAISGQMSQTNGQMMDGASLKEESSTPPGAPI